MVEGRLRITENVSANHSFGNKHKVYYIDGVVAKSAEELQNAVNDRKSVELVDKKTGQRRYLDFEQGKWIKTNE